MRNGIGRTIKRVPSSKCTGCFACMNVCKKEAISMREDNRGFLHPHIDPDMCIHCGACYFICPINKEVQQDSDIVPTSYSLTASPEISSISSSGGAFSILASFILEKGGVVYGARSNGLEEVWHEGVSSISELDALRRSKYFQSNIGHSYREAKEILSDKSKQVLFVGTPCQIAGFKNYLQKDYPNLITCDLICHGVPSKAIFRRFVKEVEKDKNAKLIKYYRDPAQWAPCIFTSEYTRCPDERLLYSASSSLNNSKAKQEWKEVAAYDKDWFNLLFHSNLIQRKSCRHCQFCKVPRVGDITLGDDWRYYNRHVGEPEKLKLGRSYVIINNSKGAKVFEDATKGLTDIEPAGYLSGGHITIPPETNPLSELFFFDVKIRKITKAMWSYTTQKSLPVRIILCLINLEKKTKKFVKQIIKNKYK